MSTIDLFNADCLEIMGHLIPDNSIDLILCDLPYGTTQNAWDSILPLKKLWDEYVRITKETAPIMLTAAQPFTSALVSSNFPLFKYEWVWEKTSSTNYLNAKKQPLRAHEAVLVFYRKQPVYNPQKTFGHARKISTAHHKRNSVKTTNYGVHGLTTYDSTERYPRDIIVFALDKQKSALHPTQKPVALMEYLIKTYTNEGMMVLDNCMGSGTTGVAAKKLNRNFIGIEKDPEYFKIAEARINETQAGGSLNEA